MHWLVNGIEALGGCGTGNRLGVMDRPADELLTRIRIVREEEAQFWSCRRVSFKSPTSF